MSKKQMRQDTLQPYYTKSSPIVTTMLDNLQLGDGHTILEPCGGDGVFVEALLARSTGNKIDVVELDPQAVQLLQHKYTPHPAVTIYQRDFLTASDFPPTGRYDRIIANPPYGAWQERDKRQRLKKLFPGLYVKETYTLFLYKAIQLLKVGGRLTFIIPDTFLNLHRHTRFRQRLLRQCQIERLQLFPSRFFPAVNFGYAGLCILTLEKAAAEPAALHNRFTVETGYPSAEALPTAAGVTRHHFQQAAVLRQPDAAVFVADDPAVTACLNSATTYLGDAADCVTGFYSGNDKRFLRSASPHNRNRRKYRPLVEHRRFSGPAVPLEGIDDERCFIPIVKGGNIPYYKQNDWYMDWSRAAVRHYQTAAKPRFQNARFYFREGLAVPMVSSKALSASLLDGRLFDQSIVGVFPHDEAHLFYLLALLNSPTANKLIRTINPTANNSANYLKKIPLKFPDAVQLKRLTALTRALVTEAQAGASLTADKITTSNEIIRALYHF